MFMLTDRSTDYQETWDFLERRLVEVTAFGKAAGENLAVVNAVAAGASSLATAGMDLVRPFAQAPGRALPEIMAGVNALYSSAVPRSGSPSTGDTAGKPEAQTNPLAAVAIPVVSTVAAIAANVARAVQAAGISLPQLPPMVHAFLAVASNPMAAPGPLRAHPTSAPDQKTELPKGELGPAQA
jgi:hypothetical protein